MSLQSFFASFLHIINEMSPYLLLGFLIAGVRKDIRKQIGKTFGDTVHVTFCERE